MRKTASLVFYKLDIGAYKKCAESAAVRQQALQIFYAADANQAAIGQETSGGKLVENRLSEDQGEFDRDYTMNVGSYYDKVYAPYLLTESVDNFISDSLNDFVDPRTRAVSMAAF